MTRRMSYMTLHFVIYAILRFLQVSANQFVNVLLCSELKLRSFRDVEVP